jgi:poly-D-alanine transfer protein DltD
MSDALLQGRFAENLAICINSHLNPLEQQQMQIEQQQAQDRAAAEAADRLAHLYNDDLVMSWVETLTEDPSMAALLEPIVAHAQQVNTRATMAASSFR